MVFKIFYILATFFIISSLGQNTLLDGIIYPDDQFHSDESHWEDGMHCKHESFPKLICSSDIRFSNLREDALQCGKDVVSPVEEELKQYIAEKDFKNASELVCTLMSDLEKCNTELYSLMRNCSNFGASFVEFEQMSNAFYCTQDSNGILYLQRLYEYISNYGVRCIVRYQQEFIRVIKSCQFTDNLCMDLDIYFARVKNICKESDFRKIFEDYSQVVKCQ